MKSSFSRRRRCAGVLVVLFATSCGDGGGTTMGAADAEIDVTTANEGGAETDAVDASTATADASTEAMTDDTSVDQSNDATPAETGGDDGSSFGGDGETGTIDVAPLSPIACDGPGARFVTDIVSYRFGDGQNFGQDAFPSDVYGPPKGAGCCLGSLDVVSLGNGGTVTVAFSGNAIVDGPGPDFLVFENAFSTSNDPERPYAELGIVDVSQDGINWFSFPCTATSYPYGMCAGWHPVFANPDKNQIDPTDPTVAGGDPFDLADVGLQWARQVRITDRSGDALVFDLDAVAIVHPMCP